MGEVYKHALLNISADMASNSSETCFADRNPMSFQPFPLNLASMSDTYLVPESTRLLHTLNFSPLAGRAWVVQERVLAPRVLHFTSQQLIWECGELFACETYPRGMPAYFDNLTPRRYMSLSRHRSIHPSEVRPAWGHIIRYYSRCFLTKPEDKLVALSGIAKDFQSRVLSDKYLAGLWEADLHPGLLWHIDSANRSNFPSSRPAIYRAPTWSWLSIDGPVSYASGDFFFLYHLGLIDAEVSLKGEDPNGEVKAGSIRLRELLRPVSLPRRIGAGLNSRRIVVDGEDMLFDDSIEYIEDVLDESPQEDGLFLLIRSYSGVRAKHLEGLVLEEIEEQNTYRRLGWFCTPDSATLAMRYKLCPGGPRLGNPWAGLFASRGYDGDGIDGELDELEAEQNNIYDLDPDHDTRRFERLREVSITIV